MKKNALSSLALAFGIAFIGLADNLGTATKVGSLSRSTDYVYTADQADAVIATLVPTNRTVNGHALSANVEIRANDIEYNNELSVSSAINYAWSLASSGVHTVKIGSQGSNLNNEGTVTIPLADTEGPGVVQLSSSTNGTSTAKAATESAVKDAIAGAKAYADAKAASVAYTHPTYTARTGKPTADASPSFGGTFTVSQITSDSSGHVTGATDRTITIPTLPTASTSAAGIVQLSSSTNGTSTAKAATESAVKAALDGAKAYADTKASAGVTKSAVAAALLAQGISSADNLDDMDALAAQIAKIVAVLEALD